MAIPDGAGRIGRVVLCLLLCVDCTDHRESDAGKQPGATVAKNNGRHRGGEERPGPMNAFPSDYGPVPQLRGADDRPPAMKPPKSKTIPRQGPTPGNGEGVSEGTLVLYDDAGVWGYLGELYALSAGHLASHFGSWSALRVADYEAGDMLGYSAVIYIGSTYDQPLPVAFLDDVLSKQRHVVWMYDNIWQLANRAQGFAATYGFDPWRFDTSPVGSVVYKGTTLTRSTQNGSGIMSYSVLDPAKATVLASAVRADGSTFPWAVRAGNFTYIGEIPFNYVNETDRYLAFSDMLFDVLAPATPERHRALVRIEDVSADTNPQSLKAIADYLHGEGVPFGIALVSVFVDPNGVLHGGTPFSAQLSSVPSVVDAVQYMVSKGGKIVMHGFTHQYAKASNPYSGVSADDFEFWLAHVDSADYVVYDGPVAEDSKSWATDRIDKAFQEIAAAGLPRPSIFEYPHYAGSAVDSQVVAAQFEKAYHRGLYFSGLSSGGQPDYKKMIGQFFPYTVVDVYGLKMIPETLGAYAPVGYNNHPPRGAADIVSAAKAQRVVRDNVASFYFHPFLPIDALKTIVQGIVSTGYGFADPQNL